MNVKIEGKNVCRHMDLTTHNHGSTTNTLPGPYVDEADNEKTQDDVEKCPYCDKPEHEFAEKWGESVGNSQKLRKKIIDPIENHAWYTGSRSLEAHHLICSEAMQDDDWPEYCRIFGYNINHKNNGVMLPKKMALACQLHVPLHRGNHYQGIADNNSYPKRIKAELDKVKASIKAGKYCDDPKALVKKLDNLSKLILKKIDKFIWTITGDGKDYAEENNGCAGVSKITEKPNAPCPHDRMHGLTKQNSTIVLLRKSGALQIGR